MYGVKVYYESLRSVRDSGCYATKSQTVHLSRMSTVLRNMNLGIYGLDALGIVAKHGAPDALINKAI